MKLSTNLKNTDPRVTTTGRLILAILIYLAVSLIIHAVNPEPFLLWALAGTLILLVSVFWVRSWHGDSARNIKALVVCAGIVLFYALLNANFVAWSVVVAISSLAIVGYILVKHARGGTKA